MNISPDGISVRFKTEPEELFEAEKSGAKQNTVRILDVYEADRIRRKPPEKIFIQHQHEILLRTLTHIHFNYNVLGKVIVVFSWTNESHHHAPTVGAHSVPVEPGPHKAPVDSVPEGDHNMSLDPAEACLQNGESATVIVKIEAEGAAPIDLSQIAIFIPRTLLAGLNLHRRMTPLPEFLSKLLEEHCITRAEERGPLHD